MPLYKLSPCTVQMALEFIARFTESDEWGKGNLVFAERLARLLVDRIFSSHGRELLCYYLRVRIIKKQTEARPDMLSERLRWVLGYHLFKRIYDSSLRRSLNPWEKAKIAYEIVRPYGDVELYLRFMREIDERATTFPRGVRAGIVANRISYLAFIGRLDEAEALYRKYREKYPNKRREVFTALMNIATAFGRFGLMRKQLDAYREILDDFPDMVQAQGLSEKLLNRIGELEIFIADNPEVVQ